MVKINKRKGKNRALYNYYGTAWVYVQETVAE